MIVLDASAWVVGLVDSGTAGDGVRQLMGTRPAVVVPAHCRLEVVRTLARMEHSGTIASEVASAFLEAVLSAEVREIAAHDSMLRVVWQLRHNISPYDAPYVALARQLEVPLVTCDGRLATTAETLGVDVRHVA